MTDRNTLRLDLRDQLAKFGRSWGWFAFFGVVSIVAGVLALAWPGRTLIVLGVLFGAQLVVGGIFRLVGAVTFDEGSGSARALAAVLGVFGLLVGLYALRHIVITVLALGLVLGIYWVIDGVMELFTAIEHPVDARTGVGRGVGRVRHRRRDHAAVAGRGFAADPGGHRRHLADHVRRASN